MIRVPTGIWQRSRSVLSWCIPAMCIVMLAAPLDAQGRNDKEPQRPSFRAGVDSNDWTEFYKRGMSLIATRPSLAAVAFYWAERLDPTRAEPMYARWAAHWLNQPQLLKDYASGSERVLNSPSVQRLDSLNYEARLRNPMVNQAVRRLVLTAMYDYADGRGNWQWNTDAPMLAWLDYTDGNFPRAVKRYGMLIDKDPEKHYYMRHERALAYASMRQFDSAAVDLVRLVEGMHKRDQKRLVYFYESKAMFEYAAGLMYMEARRHEEAREAFMRALSEDLAFYPAHSALGTILLALGDTAGAIGEYEQAVALHGADVVTRYNFALVLINARKPDAALEHLRVVVRSEPHFAAPYYYLGRILDAQGKHSEAMPFYNEFLSHAPRSLGQAVAFVSGRMSEFNAAGVVATSAPGAGQ